MLLPGAGKATIDPAKLRDYLLSPTHPIGRFKARFFAALGSLRGVGGSSKRPFGYTIRAILNGPNGQSAVVVSVWFIPASGMAPRFVTAYPGDNQ